MDIERQCGLDEDKFAFRNEIIRIDVIVQAIRLNYIEQK